MRRADARGEATRISIVFADNDPLVLDAIGELLRSKGYDVHVAEDGLAAWQLIREVRPTYVLLDVVMPKLDGSRLCWMIRQDSDTAGHPGHRFLVAQRARLSPLPRPQRRRVCREGRTGGRLPEHPAGHDASPDAGTHGHRRGDFRIRRSAAPRNRRGDAPGNPTLREHLKCAGPRNDRTRRRGPYPTDQRRGVRDPGPERIPAYWRVRNISVCSPPSTDARTPPT